MLIAFLIVMVLWVLNPIVGAIALAILFAVAVSRSVKKTMQRKSFWIALVIVLVGGLLYTAVA